MLTTAREAAGQVRGKAQDHADQLRRRSRAEVAHLRDEAHAEATPLRDEVAGRGGPPPPGVDRRGRGRDRDRPPGGRSMVSEARAVRERMLADLARRRDGARAQLAALRGERDRIVNAIEATRDHLDRLMDDLRAASPEDDRELPPVPYEQDLRAVTDERAAAHARPATPPGPPGPAAAIPPGRPPTRCSASLRRRARCRDAGPGSERRGVATVGPVEDEGASEPVRAGPSRRPGRPDADDVAAVGRGRPARRWREQPTASTSARRPPCEHRRPSSRCTSVTAR